MNTQEVASKLVALCRDQKWLEAINILYADEIVSVEAQEIGEMPAEMRVLDRCAEKRSGLSRRVRYTVKGNDLTRW